MAQRASEQAIGFLMQQGLENPDCLSLAAGFVDPVTLPVELVRRTTADLLSQQSVGQIVLQYGTTQGSECLREVFRGYLAGLEGRNSRMAELPLSRIILTTGSQQLLALTSQAIFNEGDICLVAAPTYFVYLAVLEGVGAQVIPVKTDGDGMCPNALDAELQRLSDNDQLHRVKLVYVVSYHDNPSGVSVAAVRRQPLVEVVRKWSTHNHIFLLEDAAYRELHYDGPHLPSIWSFDTVDGEDREHVILSQTFFEKFCTGFASRRRRPAADIDKAGVGSERQRRFRQYTSKPECDGGRPEVGCISAACDRFATQLPNQARRDAGCG